MGRLDWFTVLARTFTAAAALGVVAFIACAAMGVEVPQTAKCQRVAGAVLCSLLVILPTFWGIATYPEGDD